MSSIDEGAPHSEAPATQPPPARTRFEGPQERGWWWDLNLEGGLGLLRSNDRLFGMGRVRVGAAYMAEPLYFTLGPTYEYSTFHPATLGLQAEVLHLWSGLWAQMTGLYDFQPRPGVAAAAGLSVFGVEGQMRWDTAGQRHWAVFAKLRIPVSWILQIGKPPRIPPAPAK